MKTSDFHYDLPPALIAQNPVERRSSSRLLHYRRDTGAIGDHAFHQLADFLRAGDCLVFNDTRVIPARLFGHKPTGGKVEILIERLVDEFHAVAHIKASKTPKPGSVIALSGESNTGVEIQVTGRQGALFVIASTTPLTAIMDVHGHMPLPPYIDRSDDSVDAERYQTVYASKPGAVAAPTAGLHFDQPLLDAIAEKNVRFAYVTLHVGAGTFQPVRCESIEDHHMHTEFVSVGEQAVARCRQAKEAGGRVIAVGTTAVRSLETASRSGRLASYRGDTSIFIYPGYSFRTVDAMITNFHLPESTLLMLISAFAGREEVLRCYRHAIEQRYRFFSYGDAMLIT